MLTSSCSSVAALTGTGRLWAGLKPLHVVQPDGPSFTVNGSSIAWQKWHMRMSFNHREGLVLHNIGCAEAAPFSALCVT